MTLEIQSFYIPAVALTVIPGITISNLDSTGLRIEWTVSRDNTNNADTGEITVYNLSPKVSGLIYEAWQAVNVVGFATGLSLTLSVGWNRIPKIMLQGDIWDMVPDQRTATDVLTIFRVGDGLQQERDAVVGRDLQGVEFATALSFLVVPPPSPDDAGGGGLGLIFPPESKALVAQAAANINLQRLSNITKGFNVRDAISILMETLGLEWRVQNGAFIAMRGGLINRPGPTITPGSGLISWQKRNDGGIVVDALADVRAEPGIRMQVLDKLGKPVSELSYRVEKVEFAGSTDEGSLMTVSAAKARAL